MLMVIRKAGFLFYVSMGPSNLLSLPHPSYFTSNCLEGQWLNANKESHWFNEIYIFKRVLYKHLRVYLDEEEKHAFVLVFLLECYLRVKCPALF